MDSTYAETLEFAAKILEDSISPAGKRLTTFVVTFPRSVLAEFNTHREFSRNSASSRAIPVSTQIKMVMENPFIPDRVGRNKSGMQSGELFAGEALKNFQNRVLVQRDRSVIGVFEHLLGEDRLAELVGNELPIIMTQGLGQHPSLVPSLIEYYQNALKTDEAATLPNVHKETVNRYLEPYMWHTVIVTATEWSNFFALRCHPDADPKIQGVAYLMRDAMRESTPTLLKTDEWHTPFLDEEEKKQLRAGDKSWLDVSVGRSARVSYLTHFGTRDPDKDIELATRLRTHGHMSPYEHVATPAETATEVSGNFKGWLQLRKSIPFENDFSLYAE